MLADRYDGKRLNSPNDVVVRSDGSIWFTDPSYGIDSRLRRPSGRQRDRWLLRLPLDPATGDLRMVADDFVRPNGLAFSLDESRLYIVDTRVNHIRVFDVAARRQLSAVARSSSSARSVCSTGSASTTPVASGRPPATVCTASTPTGRLIGKLRLPEAVSNLAFGGLQRNRLFVTATTSLYSIRLTVNGAPTGLSAV